MKSGEELTKDLLIKYKKAVETDTWDGYMGKDSGINSLSVPAWLRDSLVVEEENQDQEFE